MALPSLFRNCSCAVPYSRRVFKTEWAEPACAWETEAAGPFLWIWLEDRRARVRGQSAGCLLHPDLTHRSDCRTRLPSLNCHPVKTFECRLQQKHRARSYGHTKVDHSEPCPQGACEPAEWFCRFTIDAPLDRRSSVGSCGWCRGDPWKVLKARENSFQIFSGESGSPETVECPLSRDGPSCRW